MPELRTGTSWASAYTQPQRALDLASTYDFIDEVWVAEGIYRPTAEDDSEASFELRSEVALYGGFDGTEAVLDQRDWEANESVLSGDIGLGGDPSDNSRNVVTADDVTSAILDGFTITGGHGVGGGLFANSSEIAVLNSKFHGNQSPNSGGACS